ncbi:outer membrane assembly protein BamC [Vibrio sp. UCD-FRSSP16_10]|uniref:outer membrane protein assembly factor BamC n=1 Tax=unclassified Vibrio TaxID=2614977 RepID=UPI0007FE34C0|nr:MULTISPECIES: outer membrane protein assembly factor BamC [unclassified Vibrio]OBT16920.1 outer membrane assembly protein BamC [Vibrio sp. UCD-FRSSP16_30]OBT21908.1 outer membrane assembly protein BamC [Vibrio sp. UCD-FRSSP16_10]
MKFVNQLVISALAVAMLSGCAENAAERRQAKDDFKYLEATPMPDIVSSPEQQLEVYPDYVIPKGDYVGGIGKEVDIRPPQQVLELIPGARTEQNDGVVTLWLLTQDDRDKVWQTAKDMIEARDIKLLDSSDDRLETDWIVWHEEDEEETLSSRYLIERFEANSRFGFRISLIAWKEGSTEMPVSYTDKERYNTFMTNIVMSRYDDAVRAEAAKQALQLVKVIPLSLGKDRSGLPIVIARARYDVFWQRIPELLPTLGFELDERNQSQGTIKTSYAAPDDEFWESIGTKPLTYNSETYTFLLGDLGNRTSINVTDAAGKPVTEEMLKELIPTLSIMMEQSSQSTDADAETEE